MIKNGRGNMPAFSSPDAQIQELATFVRSMNADAFDMKPAGDTAAGAGIFFGSGHCAECHTAQGRGGADGPDLSRIGRQATLPELEQSLATTRRAHRHGLRARGGQAAQWHFLAWLCPQPGAHDLQLQTFDGRVHLLADDEYIQVVADKHSFMPAFKGTPEQYRDLVAFLSRLDGVPIGPNLEAKQKVTSQAIDQVLHPKLGDWPTYSGNVNGNRYSLFGSINVRNVSSLRPAWIHSLPYFGLRRLRW